VHHVYEVKQEAEGAAGDEEDELVARIDLMMLLGPALILFTLGLLPVASAALLLFLGYASMYIYASRKTIPEAQKVA